ncbi:MAG: AIPR family protein [Candidatus Diapherotrites archaeon]|jgi:hypothetical protein|nr:AIPR family protein [Candidatus Diapherotrites archaeon]MBT4596872.1 AIPR family protein [Candidatus Diapherotrites archaeon]
MDEEEFASKMREEVNTYTYGGRQDSSAFLIWFLENFFRLEEQDAIDSVCDKTNDKGIDGIWVDDEGETIYLFQSKFSPNEDQSQGDNDLRNFMGAKEWFRNEATLADLTNSTACKELKSLVNRKKLASKTEYKKVLCFTTNKLFNTHANEYIEITQNLETYDFNSLFDKYSYFADEDNNFEPTTLFISNKTKIKYDLPDGSISRIYSIKAKELIKLKGIQDRSLFYKNVRYSVGNTRVNKSIKNTIANVEDHNDFFLYHNGITITCEKLEEPSPENKIILSGYAVVNGCQSMLSFFENKENLSNNLYVLVKIIQLDRNSPKIKKITFFTNNQNSISIKDLRSNDSVQKAIQTEFKELFGTKVFYRRKRGEDGKNAEIILEKDFVAQILEATYHEKPQNTHLKQKLFGDEYSTIFSRKTNASKIFFAYLINQTIKNNSHLLTDKKIQNYGLATFFFSHVIFEILKQDDCGKKLIESPIDSITNSKEPLIETLTELWNEIVPDINYDLTEYTKENDGFFDYKNVFKNTKFVDTMTNKLKSHYTRLTTRGDRGFKFSVAYTRNLEKSK